MVQVSEIARRCSLGLQREFGRTLAEKNKGQPVVQEQHIICFASVL